MIANLQEAIHRARNKMRAFLSLWVVMKTLDIIYII